MARIARQDRHHALIVPTCTVCGSAVTAHFDVRGRWAGCRPMLADPTARYILIPDRRHAPPIAGIESLQGVSVSATPDLSTNRAIPNPRRTSAITPTLRSIVTPPVQPVRTQRQTRLLYVAAFGPRDAKAKRIASDRDREVLATIARHRAGVSRPELLQELNASKRTGIVDGAVRRLRLRKAITTKIVTEA